MRILQTAAAVALGLLAPCALHATSLCPAVGDATAGCDLIITVTDTGFTVAAGPSYNLAGGTYDGSDDSLIGIINNSSHALSSLTIPTNTDAFGFDGDGIDGYGVTGNVKDNTGYGGPNSYFTNISSNYYTGTVNFIAPLAANGGNTYFGLEEALKTTNFNQTPEPSTWVLLGTGVASLGGAIRRRFSI